MFLAEDLAEFGALAHSGGLEPNVMEVMRLAIAVRREHPGGKRHARQDVRMLARTFSRHQESKLARALDTLYAAQGFMVVFRWCSGSCRSLVAMREAAVIYACTDADWSRLCTCVRPGYQLSTGTGILNSDLELFQRLRRHLPRSPRAFVVGNAFGFSTLALALVFGGGSVDAIDAEVEGRCNRIGSSLTRRIAKASELNVSLFQADRQAM